MQRSVLKQKTDKTNLNLKKKTEGNSIELSFFASR